MKAIIKIAAICYLKVFLVRAADRLYYNVPNIIPKGSTWNAAKKDQQNN